MRTTDGLDAQLVERSGNRISTTQLDKRRQQWGYRANEEHGKIKHIDIHHHYIRELLHSGTITMEQVPSSENLADLFTKPLSRDLHHRILAGLDIK